LAGDVKIAGAIALLAWCLVFSSTWALFHFAAGAIFARVLLARA
jgi:hypothetical protein